MNFKFYTAYKNRVVIKIDNQTEEKSQVLSQVHE